MKITKRILAILLLAALLVSCMLLSVSAEGPFNAEGIGDIDDIIEYYAFKDYLAENYEEGTFDTAHYSGTGDEVITDPFDDTNKVFKVTGKGNKYFDKPETDKLVVSFDICYDASMVGEYKLNLKMIDAKGEENLTYTSMFTLNTREGVFQYSHWDEAAEYFLIQNFEGIVPQPDVWYNVVVFFDTAENNYFFKISADGKETWTQTDNFSLGGAQQLVDFELKSTTKRSDTIFLYLDNVEVYEGTFERNPSNKNDITAQTIVDLEALYLADETTSDVKIKIAEVFDKLINTYEFKPADSTPNKETVDEIIKNIPEYINLAYAEEFVRRANSIDVNSGYYNRLSFIDESEDYGEKLPADEELAGAPGFVDDAALVDAVIAARKAFMEEASNCVKVAEDSVAFVKAMKTYNAASVDYDGYLKAFYENVTSYALRDATYAEPIEEIENFTMADAVLLFEDFDAKYTKLNDAANSFIQGATMMKTALELMNSINEETGEPYAPHEQKYEEAFAQLAEGYLLADAVYNGGDIDENLDETTHSELSALFSVYTENRESILSQIEICEKFLDIIKKAQIATYYTAIVEQLNEADAIIYSVRDKYKGVTEALEVYESLKAAVEESEKASTAYKAAVNAILVAEGFEAKQKAIETALQLKEKGDVIGIEGVKEANIILSEEMTKIETIISSSDLLKLLVVEIQVETSFAARRELLARAEVAASTAEATLEGVADALEKFNSFKSDYVNTVAAMNSTHNSAIENAADIAGAAASDAGVYKAADIIKNFID